MKKLFFILFAAVSIYAEESQPLNESAKQFEPFTGKIVGNNVRMRIKPDLDSQIISQLNKSDVVLVLGEKDIFFEVAAPGEIKAYVYKSYVNDDKVEASRVNVRLSPHTEAPIVAQLQTGDQIKGEDSCEDNKWLVIDMPSSVHFYIAKEYVSSFDKAEAFDNIVLRKEALNRALKDTLAQTELEMNKPYEEMKIQEVLAKLDGIVKDYADYPDTVKTAEEYSKKLQDNFLQKKVSFLEVQKNKTVVKKEEAPLLPSKTNWQSLEKDLFTTWSTFHPEKTLEEFYNEQKVNAITIVGVLERFKPLKNRPGDYVIKNQGGIPIAYLYSTIVDLEKYVGKQIEITASPRPNNNFAFPAYFVNTVEK